MTVKERLHRLVDTLPEGELHTAERFLEYLRNTPGAVDPVLWAHLRVPLDDLPADADDLDGELTAARAEPSVSHEEARRVLRGVLELPGRVETPRVETGRRS